MARMKTYRITKAGANHTIVEPGTKNRKILGVGDEIQLTDEQYNTPGKYNNLGLRSVTSSGRVKADERTEEELAAETPETDNPRRSSQGSKSDRSDPAAVTAEDDAADEDGRDTESTGDDLKVDDEDKTEDNEEEVVVDQKKLDKLIDTLENAHGTAGIAEAREAIVKADLFEADTLPTTRAALMQALLSLKSE